MIRQASGTDIAVLAKLAVQMWDSHSLSDLENEFTELIGCSNTVVYIKCVDEIPIGFAQCQLRHDYVEGTSTSPVGYLEGIFVAKEFRHHGFAKELLSACECWAKSKGCSEFASDCELGNEESLKFHLAVNFQEENRIICFRKNI